MSFRQRFTLILVKITAVCQPISVFSFNLYYFCLKFCTCTLWEPILIPQNPIVYLLFYFCDMQCAYKYDKPCNTVK